MFTGFTVSGSSLPLMNVGEQGVIARLAKSDAEAVRDLKSLGLTQGTKIRLVERFPSFVVSTGAKRVALNKRLSRSVYVRLKEAGRHR
jgi:ferrous iron transport protein A